MSSKFYRDAIVYAATIAPTLYRPSEFIRWAEDIANLIAHIYSMDYNDVTEDLYDTVKQYQDYEDEDDESSDED